MASIFEAIFNKLNFNFNIVLNYLSTLQVWRPLMSYEQVFSARLQASSFTLGPIGPVKEAKYDWIKIPDGSNLLAEQLSVV